KAGACRFGAGLREGGSHRVPRRRQEDENAQTPLDDRSRSDTGRVSGPLGAGGGLSDGRSRLRGDPAPACQGNRLGPQAGPETGSPEEVRVGEPPAVEKAPSRFHSGWALYFLFNGARIASIHRSRST